MASIDPDGNLIIRDRSKDVIKSGGEWISSIDLEKFIIAMKTRDGVGLAFSMVAVVAQPHPKWDERPVLAVVPADKEKGIDEADLLAQMARHLAKWQMPDAVITMDSLPMTATGKISKKDLRSRIKVDFGDDT